MDNRGGYHRVIFLQWERDRLRDFIVDKLGAVEYGHHTMNREQSYIEASHAWIPDAYDIVEYPDNLPFYRSWQGVVAALGVQDYSKLDERAKTVLHNPICMFYRLPIEQQWKMIVRELRGMVEAWQPPAQPSTMNRGFYEYAPAEPTEHDARQFFNQEYKRAFPGKRANSKDANAKWTVKKDKAMAILRKRYQAQLAYFEELRQQAEERQSKARQEWIDKFHGQAIFEAWVRTL